MSVPQRRPTPGELSRFSAERIGPKMASPFTSGADSKSGVPHGTCGFKSRLGHHQINDLRNPRAGCAYRSCGTFSATFAGSVPHGGVDEENASLSCRLGPATRLQAAAAWWMAVRPVDHPRSYFVTLFAFSNVLSPPMPNMPVMTVHIRSMLRAGGAG